MAELVREAVSEWLDRHGVHRIEENEWNERLGRLLERRSLVSDGRGWEPAAIEHDVAAAVADVRRIRAARRR